MKNIGNIIGKVNQLGLERTPSPKDHIVSLEVGLQSSLPSEYHLILEKVGAFNFGDYKLYDPSSILAYCSYIYNLEGIPPHKWPVVPIAKFQNFGDDIGFLREGESFSDKVYLLSHEGPWTEENNYWYKQVSSSLSDLILDNMEKA